jgi:hypothetical protein
MLNISQAPSFVTKKEDKEEFEFLQAKCHFYASEDEFHLLQIHP